MRSIAKWIEEHAHNIGALILICVGEAGKGKEDQIDLDLDGKWFRIYVDPAAERVVFFPISAPKELREDTEGD